MNVDIVETIVVLDIVDIEEYVREGRPVPHAHRYKYRVNKQHFISEEPEITREQILERAGLVPTDQYRLRLKRRHGPPEEIKPGERVHLREHGIERFIAQPKEVQDGLEARREFVLSPMDTAFLDGLQSRWEALNQNGRLWVVIYGVPLPAGFQVPTADVAIEIAAGYPTSQLDMAYFHPALVLTSGRPVRSVEAIEQIDGKAWQRWSRHRIGKSVWISGADNLEKHFAYMQDWLAREVE
jgi:Prokaryotic E2 family E/Multiubiquitin